MPPPLASIPQPPFGSTPLTRPSGNAGDAANSAAMVQEAVNMLEKALSGIPPQHPLHKAALTAISNLSKHAPPAAASPGVGLQALKQMLAQKMQASPLAALMAGQGGGGAPGAAPTGPVPAAGAGAGVSTPPPPTGV